MESARHAGQDKVNRSGGFVGFHNEDKFDWLAIVILPGLACETRRIFIAPCEVVLRRSYDAKQRDGRGFFVHKLVSVPPCPVPSDPVPAGGWGLADYENNFALSRQPVVAKPFRP
jgi:hypothetical protein